MAEDLLGAQDLIFLEENHFSFVKSQDHFASGKTLLSFCAAALNQICMKPCLLIRS